MAEHNGSLGNAGANNARPAAVGKEAVSDLEFFRDYFGGRLGGGEMYRPTTSSEPTIELTEVDHSDLVRQDSRATDMPTRMARSYYLLALKRVAPQIRQGLVALQPALEAALASQLGDPRDWIDDEPPARSSSVRWLLDYYRFSLSDGAAWEDIYKPGREALQFVTGLSTWASTFHLEQWIVEAFLEAQEIGLRLKSQDWDFWLGQPWTSESCPLEPEEHVYFANRNPDAELAPEVRPLETSGRAFVFAHPGYRPAGVRRSLFTALCREQFEEALQHYVDGVERDYLAEGYMKTPEMRDAKKFEWAVLRRNLGWSQGRIENRYGQSRSTISHGIREVEKAMKVPPLKVRVTKKKHKKSSALKAK